MKKLSSFVLIVFLALALLATISACHSSPAPSAAPTVTEPVPESSVTEETEAAPAPTETEATVVSADALTSLDYESGEYRFSAPEDLLPAPYDLLDRINQPLSGTSYANHRSYVKNLYDFVRLLIQPETDTYLKVYFDAMTPLQRDFFTSGWDQLMEDAKYSAASGFKYLLDDLALCFPEVGQHFPLYRQYLASVTSETVIAAETRANALFYSYGVRRVWKDYAPIASEILPFHDSLDPALVISADRLTAADYEAGYFQYTAYDGLLPADYRVLDYLNSCTVRPSGPAYDDFLRVYSLAVLSSLPETPYYLVVYLNQMTPLQRDCFTANWDYLMYTALEDAAQGFDTTMEQIARNGFGFGESKAEMQEKLSDVTAEQLQALDREVNALFQTYGIRRVWKGFSPLADYALDPATELDRF